MKKVFKVLIVIFSIILLKLIFTFTINEIVKFNVLIFFFFLSITRYIQILFY